MNVGERWTMEQNGVEKAKAKAKAKATTKAANMNSSPRYRTRRYKRQQHTMNNVIVIDSDDNDDGATGDGEEKEEKEEDLNRKPAAKKSGAAAKYKNNKQPCISLLDSSDEENHPNGSSSGGHGLMLGFGGIKSKKRKRKLTAAEAADREFAKQLQAQDDLAAKKASSPGKERMDRKLAKQLQAQEDLAAKKASPRKEKREMIKSNEGRAVLAVQEIMALVKAAKEKFIDNNPALQQYCVEAVTIDDMVFFAKNMLDKQEEFIQNQSSGYIDIGYHYTDQRNMEHIRAHGLMTRAERDTNKIKAAPKGSVFGDGIYTANNATGFSAYGDTGLILGRLQGKIVRAARHLPPSQSITVDANTIIGDKLLGVTTRGKQVFSDGWPIDDVYHEFVLRSSAQCLPMIKFDKKLRDHADGKECVKYMKKQLKEILNRLFNNGLKRDDFRKAPLITSTALPGATAAVPPPARAAVPLPPPPLLTYAIPGMNPFPGMSATFQAASSAYSSVFPGGSLRTIRTTIPSNPSMPPPMGVTASSAPFPTSSAATFVAASAAHARTSRSSHSIQTLKYMAPQSLTTGVPSNALTAPPRSCNMSDNCVICHDSLEKRSKCVALACKHVFHRDCIQLAFQSKPQCPVCRISIGAPQGKSPSGTMTVTFSPIRCSGFVHEDSILITYNIPSAPQKSYHDTHGKRHGSKLATAYLPNNANGQDLLKRLKFSFKHGLSFIVGTSATSGITDQCTWTSVHHKTSPSGGVRSHGYPDPNYFGNCNGELDGLSVPPAHSLDDDGNDI